MNPRILTHLSQDLKLAQIIPNIALSEIDIHNDIYFDLLQSIVSQQLSIKAAATIFGRFLALFPDKNPAPSVIIDMDMELLRSSGLSGQKAGYITNIARYWMDHKDMNQDWINTDDDTIIKELKSIKGVGKWTVQMILMFRLGRLDVFPIDDLGIRQGMIGLYELEGKTGKELIREMNRIAESWKPYRSVASRYIWKWKDGNKK